MRNQLAILMVGFLLIMATQKSSQAEPGWQVPASKPTFISNFLLLSPDNNQLSPRVRQFVTLFESFDTHVRVNLCCAQARVPEHFLNGA